MKKKTAKRLQMNEKEAYAVQKVSDCIKEKGWRINSIKRLENGRIQMRVRVIERSFSS